MKASKAEIIREYGPFPGIAEVHGVTFDGRYVWFASGDKVNALDSATGEIVDHAAVPAYGGTAFDGKHVYQIAYGVIRKIDPETRQIVATIPAPGKGEDSGLAWSEGSLWVGQHDNRKIYQIHPATGAILQTIECDRFVTGVTWARGQLWHGSRERNESDIRRIDATTGAVEERIEMPQDVEVTGLESDGKDLFYCGGGPSGKVIAVRRSEKR